MDYKTYKVQSNFGLGNGRIAYAGEVLKMPGDMDEKTAVELVSLGRIVPTTTEPPMKKTMTTKTGGAGLVGGSGFFGSSKSEPGKSEAGKSESGKH